MCYRTYSIWRYGPQRFINATAQFELMRLVPAINSIYAEEMGVKGCTMTKYSALAGCSQVGGRGKGQGGHSSGLPLADLPHVALQPCCLEVRA